MPLVELRTVNQIRYYTDSNGIVAFDEPGLLNQKVYFSIRSHGYEAESDGFGYRGASFLITEGGTAQIVIRRKNIARRLYRVTGEGIYRDSVLTGDEVPIRQPLLNGQVVGQDSVVNAVFQGKIYWFWGDTNRPDYILGNFHVPGATSELPGKGGLEPEQGVDLTYFVDDKGFARPTAPMPGEGPTWLSGLTVLKDNQGRERMFAFYAKIRKTLEVYQRGLAEFNPQTQRFEKVAQFPDPSKYPGELPDGHPFLHRDRGIDYVYYANPYPLLRVRAEPDLLKEPEACQAYTCLTPGTRLAQQQLDRDSGRASTLWVEDQHPARAGRPAGQADRCPPHRPGRGAPEPARHRLGQAGAGPRRLCVLEQLSPALGDDHGRVARQHILSGRGLVRRGRHAARAVGLQPQGGHARQVQLLQPQTAPDVRQGQRPDHLLRGNIFQHVFGQSGSDAALRLQPGDVPARSFRRSAGASGGDLPVARRCWRRTPPGACDRGKRSRIIGPSPRGFLCADRDGIASLPVYEDYNPVTGQTLRIGKIGQSNDPNGPRPLFFLLPAGFNDYTAATTPLYEWQAEGRNAVRVYSTDSRSPPGGGRWKSKVLGRVWKDPAPFVTW